MRGRIPAPCPASGRADGGARPITAGKEPTLRARRTIAREAVRGTIAVVLASALGCSPDETASSAPNLELPDVVLITLDTTRADALSCGGGDGTRMPKLEEFARECWRYSLARSPSPLTVPSHTSMLTGLYPFAHGVRDNDAYRLHPEARTLAVELAEVGYRTEAVLAASVLSAKTGLDLGFEHFDDLALRRGRNLAEEVERRAEEVTARAIARVDTDDSRPLFLWVHYFDPHQPYAPPGHRTIPSSTETGASKEGDDVYADYWAEVRYLDEQLGRLLDSLRARSRWPHTTVLVVGDHGEGLRSVQEDTHGFLCEESTLRIPFLVRLPSAGSASRSTADTTRRTDTGVWIESPVSAVDVFPTVLALAGCSTPYPVHGIDLRELDSKTDQGASRAVYFETLRPLHVMGWSPLYGIADAQHKFVRNAADELFDLRSPEGERVDRATTDPESCARMREAMDTLERSIPTVFPSAAMTLSPAESARLLQLGYLSRAVDTEVNESSSEPLPDPRRHYTSFVAYQSALGHARRGDLGRASNLLQEVVRRYPNNPSFRTAYGEVLLATGRAAEAVGELEAALRLRNDHLAALFPLTRALLALGQVDPALRALDRTLELHPEHFDARITRMRLRERSGALGTALEDACAILEAFPPSTADELPELEEILALEQRLADADPDHPGLTRFRALAAKLRQ